MQSRSRLTLALRSQSVPLLGLFLLGFTLGGKALGESATAPSVVAQEVGSVRGVIYDQDFNVLLPGAKILVVETGQTAETGSQGNFVIKDVEPGTYTLVFSKDGYVRQVRTEFPVRGGQLAEVTIRLAGDFTDMEEFVVQDLLSSVVGSEAALLELRFDSPALLDGIGADLMSRAGAGDAASALRLVSGATVQDGKFAVIRGLPDRYVSSQMNGIRLPSADEDKRAVELDQFPGAVIERIEVAKTFTPDQQGDASGGAVDLRLKGVPEERHGKFKVQWGSNSQVTGNHDFISFDGGGVNFLGDKKFEVSSPDAMGNWPGDVGVEGGSAPIDFKLSGSVGDQRVLDNGWVLGGLLSAFYERDSSFFDNGVDDSLWIESPGDSLTPVSKQGTPGDGDFRTALFDVTRASESVQWGLLGTIGIEGTGDELSLTYLFTHSAESIAILAEDTRGKQHYFPGYDPDDPVGIGNDPDSLNSAPYIRTQTLQYTERDTSTLQLSGRHDFDWPAFQLGPLHFREPELSWSLSRSMATLDQPDKRQFGSIWLPASFYPGTPPFTPPSTSEPTYFPFKPGANVKLGNLQRIWKEIEEESTQLSANVKWPFDQWGGLEGYAKAGIFVDAVEREFDQDTFSNFDDLGSQYQGSWDDPWSDHFPLEAHVITAADTDVDYRGSLDISALYGMLDIPVSTAISVIGGVRVERTELGIVNTPEADSLWFPLGSLAPTQLNLGDADVTFRETRMLPSLGVIWETSPEVTLRASVSQTLARQTFKELTPIIQQEFLGGPIFIGNPDLETSSLTNFDLRVDYRPSEASLVSLSLFQKNIDDPIEYVQRNSLIDYTTAVNYPKGRIQGVELELRQDLQGWWSSAEGFKLGANATFIDSEVWLPQDEIEDLADLGANFSTRDMTGAPEHLYNINLTYDFEETGTQVGLFYTVKGDTLVSGAAETKGNLTPNVYQLEQGHLNLSVQQPLGERWKLSIVAKNLTNSKSEQVYRAAGLGDETKTSRTSGTEFSISLSVNL